MEERFGLLDRTQGSHEWYRDWKVSNREAPPKPTEEFDLVGFASEHLLAFTVNFGEYGSLTAWVGLHTIVGKSESTRCGSWRRTSVTQKSRTNGGARS